MSSQPDQNHTHDESNVRNRSLISQLALSEVSDIRTYVTVELSRMKDDISDIYDKLNAVKDASAADRLAMLSQLNAEFAKFNNRLNDFAVVIQQIMGESEHHGSVHAADLKALLSEVDNRMLRCKLEYREFDHSSEIAVLTSKFTDLEKSVTDLKSKLAMLQKKENSTSDKLKSLALKTSLIMAVLLYLGKEFVLPLIKTGVEDTLKSKQEQLKTVIHDTVPTPVHTQYSPK